jgi:ComF family protein
MLLPAIGESLLHLAFPHICEGCGSANLSRADFLCLRCLDKLPRTNFHLHPGNPVEKVFWGRLPLVAAMAQYYFTKESLVQRLMHRFKYRGHLELGQFLGNLMGESLAQAQRFTPDLIVPIPLFPAREQQRGFNQAAVLCMGISNRLQKPLHTRLVRRTTATETQTRKGRVARWQNMEGRFELALPAEAEGRHVLLVDDVVTTGASLEACGKALLQAANLRLSVATLCFSSY